MAGTLFVVGTPIGNLEDLTFRALRILKEVDLVAAEDTRRTAKLLPHYQIRKPLVSLREHNEQRETPRLIEKLTSGQSIALVSDAGTPGISDPGSTLVAAAREIGLVVSPIPGPSAVTAALSASGFPASEFVVLGFPPHGAGRRQHWFDRLAGESRTVVLFEAPHRIADTLGHLAVAAIGRQIAIFREMTKLNEESFVSDAATLGRYSAREQGEFVLVMGPSIDSPSKAKVVDDIVHLVGQLTSGTSFDVAEAIRMTARVLDQRESLVANVVRRQSILAKRQNDSDGR